MVLLHAYCGNGHCFARRAHCTGGRLSRTGPQPQAEGCTVSVAATFDGGSKSDADTFDVCSEKLIRFTD
jgi:hypothetical protein